MKSKETLQLKLIASVAVLVASTFVSPPTSLASSITFTGTSVTVSSLLGESDCFRTSNGSIGCDLFDYSVSMLSDQGALAGKTITDFSQGSDYYSNTSCAVTSEGKAACWGENSYAAVGDNTVIDRSAPTSVYVAGALSGVSLAKISTNSSQTCAISTTGSMYCWGYQGGSSNYLRVGVNAEFVTASPVTDSQITSHTWRDVRVNGTGQVCGLTTTDLIRCWSYGTFSTINTVALVNGESLLSFANLNNASSGSGCVLSSLGNVYCWGSTTYLSRVSGISSSNAGKVPFSSAATRIATNGSSVCAVIQAGAVECMGYGFRRTTGLGVSGYPVVAITGTGTGGESIANVAMSSGSSVAFLRNDGVLKTHSRSDTLDLATSTGTAFSMRTPDMTISWVNVYSTFSRPCVRTISQGACLNVRVPDYDDYTAYIYTNAAGTSLLKTVEFDGYSDSVTEINGFNTHWVKIGKSNNNGQTLSTLYRVDPLYRAPTVSISSAGIESGSGYFMPYINYNSNSGGMTESISKQIRKSGSTSWTSLSSLSSSWIKTSTKYELRVTNTTSLGSSSDVRTILSPNLLRKRSVYRNSRATLTSVFRVDSPGRKTWTALSGCKIRGAYLVTGNFTTCRLRLAIKSASGYPSSSQTYSFSVY